MARRTYKRSRRLPPEEMEPRVEDQPIPMDQPTEQDQPDEWSPEGRPGRLRQAEALHSMDQGRCYVWPELFFNPKAGAGRKRIMVAALASPDEALDVEDDVPALRKEP